MKRLLLILVLLLNLTWLQSQDWKAMAGFQMSTEGSERFHMLGIQVKMDYVLMEIAWLENFQESRLAVKCGFRMVEHGPFSAYFYLPYLNYSISENGYNTPLSFDVFYTRNFSLGADIYVNRTVVTAKARWFITQ